MAVSYKKLWKLLIDKDFKKKDLCEKAGISPATITKMGKNGHVTTEVLLKICTTLNCGIEDIMEIVPEWCIELFWGVAICAYESVITVAAFVVIMLCYYLRDTVEEKIKQECEKMKAETETRRKKKEELQEAELSKQLLEAAKNAVERINNKEIQKNEGADKNG